MMRPLLPALAIVASFLLVLLDDAGFMDFGAYGSDTATHNIDELAQSGVMFTRYYTHPLCRPSRAALLTGQDNHLVGAGCATWRRGTLHSRCA